MYQFTCCCTQTYVGQTSQCSSVRIEQHIPHELLTLRSGIPGDRADLAVSQQCLSKFYDDDCRNEAFRILAHARHDLHLDSLEAFFIHRLSPALCTQKQHVRELQLSPVSQIGVSPLSLKRVHQFACLVQVHALV